MKKPCFAAVLIWASCVSAFAQDFYAISGISSSTSATDLWPVSNLIQGPGVGFDANSPYDRLIGGSAGLWVTDAPGGFPSDYIAVAGMPVLEIDLGIDQLLGEVSVWGYDANNANGASAFALRFATGADGSAGFGTSIAANPSFAGLANNSTVRQSFTFDAVTARYIEMTITDNFFIPPGDGSGGGPAGGDRVGLGEVAFQVVPEPSTGALMVGGLVLLGLRRWRKPV